MTDNNPSINTREYRITDFVKSLAQNKYLIPSFQRAFVWEPDEIIRLWDSIYRFYPIGSILCWITDIHLNVHRRPGGYILPDNRSDSNYLNQWTYILDGQQRATSLLISIFGGEDKVKNYRKLNYKVYFNAVEEKFFFEDKFNIIKETINRSFLIKLEDVYNDEENFLEKLAGHPEADSKIRNNILRLQYMFSNYKIPLIHIKGFDIPSVCEIFERINQEGRELKSSDVIIARTFHNYKTIIEEDM
ncbi:MAG: DUF262 domain-containing protein [Spirochaetes bacterium]|nr:DUF262 domain-containing protein [Spirochaetota bacterium]